LSWTRIEAARSRRDIVSRFQDLRGEIRLMTTEKCRAEAIKARYYIYRAAPPCIRQISAKKIFLAMALSIEIFRIIKDPAHEAYSLQEMGVLLRNLFDDRSLACFKRAYELFENNEARAEVLIHLGAAQMIIQDDSKAAGRNFAEALRLAGPKGVGAMGSIIEDLEFIGESFFVEGFTPYLSSIITPVPYWTMEGREFVWGFDLSYLELSPLMAGPGEGTASSPPAPSPSPGPRSPGRRPFPA
jgi:tetratricopeptide (TPR) repeat protein